MYYCTSICVHVCTIVKNTRDTTRCSNSGGIFIDGFSKWHQLSHLHIAVNRIALIGVPYSGCIDIYAMYSSTSRYSAILMLNIPCKTSLSPRAVVA